VTSSSAPVGSGPPGAGGLPRLAGPVGVALVAAGAAVYLGLVDPNQPGHYPTCPFLAVTGLACPGCGSLRALHALAGLDLGTALARNPLTVAALPLLVTIWAGWTLRSVTGRPRRRAAPGWLLWCLLALVLGFAVLRNLPGQQWLGP
jgi:hypothetical protein